MKRLLLLFVVAAIALVVVMAPDPGLTQARAVRVGPCTIFGGTGDPEGAQIGGICDMFLADDGGAGTTGFLKESGAGDTGWTAINDLTAMAGILASVNGGTGVNNGGRTLTITTTSGIFVFSGAFTATVPATMTLAGSTGTPVDNQIGVWTTANLIEGDTGLTFDGTNLRMVGSAFLAEIAAAAADVGGQGQLWVRDDAPATLFYTDDTGTDFMVGGYPSAWKSFTFAGGAVASGEHFQGGFYDYNVADANLNQGSLTVTHGATNVPYAAHAFIVSGGNGTTDGSDLVLTVTGTSIDDAGTRTGADSEVIEATAATSALDTYFETTKKWIGTITYTLSSTGGGTFNYDFNYGFAKYEDFGNRDFTIVDFENTGLANANDTGFEIELLHHNATGWTYHATVFVAGNTALLSMNTIYSTEQDLDIDTPFAFKRTGLSTAVAGANSEGVIVRVTTGASNSVNFMDTHIGVIIQ